MGKLGHRFTEHAADLALEVSAPTEEALLDEAARAIVGILTEGAHIDPHVSREVTLEATDPEDRLVRWLNEVIYLALVDGFLYSDASVALSEGGLCAEIHGEENGHGRLRTEVKAATYHELALELDPAGGFVGRVIVDV